MGSLARILAERTELSTAEGELLARLVEEWSIVSDLALSDLVLWVPTWNEAGFVAAAQVRPSTAPTSVPDDTIGRFMPRGRLPLVDQALAFRRAIAARSGSEPWIPAPIEAYPITREGRVIAVIARHASTAPRVAGRLEEIYLSSADDLLSMTVEGAFPSSLPAMDATDAPRVGDGLMRLTTSGIVDYASPNAINALRRLGLARELVGANLAEVSTRLSHRPGPVDASLSAVAGGRVPGSTEVENGSAAVALHGIPLIRDHVRVGALVFCRDVTDLRRRERALISKDATIREIHHRVKNNLQTVAAMLRLQARRASSDEAREALAEAELRVAAIALVHESLSGEAGEAADFDEIVDRITALVRDLAPAYAAEGAVPIIRREGSWGSLPSDLATPLAMVVSELLHNAVEHGSPSIVEVRLRRDDGSLALQVRDDGQGLPAGFDWESTGLGLSIVRSLVTGDLHGECETAGEDGTTISVRVPLVS